MALALALRLMKIEARAARTPGGGAGDGDGKEGASGHKPRRVLWGDAPDGGRSVRHRYRLRIVAGSMEKKVEVRFESDHTAVGPLTHRTGRGGRGRRRRVRPEAVGSSRMSTETTR